MSALEAAKHGTAPTGTVTFLFSDIEGSTRLLDTLGEGYADVLRRHRQALRTAFAEHGGVERGTEGDSFFVAFPDATAAVEAAAEATRNLARERWPAGAEVRVRVGVHTGEGRLVDGDYVGMDVHRAARIAAAGHGGQVLLSQSTEILVERALPAGVALRDLGEHRLKDLPAAEHLYQLDIDGEPREFPPLRSLARAVTNLPAQLPSIIGREEDVATVRELLDRSRLVTVTGPGGTGKTRLVQEVARSVVAAGQLDAAFVPLEAIHDADLIPAEVIRALRLDVAAARDPLDRIAEHLAGSSTLLVLDNLEQVAGAGLAVRSLVDRVPGATVLVSSQAALHVAGEQELALRPLGLASGTGRDSQAAEAPMPSAAVAMFVERARAVRADFALDASNGAAIAAICERLDGLPLAIELAAAQVKLLSPQAILQRIDGSLDTLASRREDLPERHRTLRATLTWSYELLGEEERRLFRRLAVFSGGARLAEVEAIGALGPGVADPIDALTTLVDRSLVTVKRADGTDDRYGLLETMRTYGRELLRTAGEEEQIAREHARIYAALAREAEPEFYRPARRAWLDRLAEEHQNLRAALDWLGAAGELAAALDLAADLWRFWQQRGHFIEGVERLRGLLDAAKAPGAPVVAPPVLSRAEEAAGSLLYWLDADRKAAQPFYERSLELAIASGDRLREAWARYNLAFVFDFTDGAFGAQTDLPRASALREEALAMFRDLGDRRGVAVSLWAMGGNASVVFKDPELARRHLSEAVPQLEAVGDLFTLGWAHISLALLHAVRGDLDAADQEVLAGADVFERDGDITGQVVAVQHLGALAARRGDDVTAARFNAAALGLAHSVGAQSPGIPPVMEPLTAAEARLDPDALAREQGVGRALGVRSILSTALEAWRATRRGAATGP
jgi:predicted ATPase/class 3 adenylate cyclase